MLQFQHKTKKGVKMFFKRKSVFKVFIWDKGLTLKAFEVKAKSKEEAESILSKREDYKFICAIKEMK